MPLDNKISNIIGTKLPIWVLNQLETRANKNTQDSRDNDNILYLTNKSAWVRLVSSVDIGSEDLIYFKNQIGANLKVEGLGVESSELNPIFNPTSLSKEYVLFGGTSKYLNKNSYGLRSGIDYDGAYGILGTNEIQQFGYKPMPGITNVTIDTQGKLGSVRAATINFKCWTKNQLDIIDALYFKLGFTMFLEWGHTYFYYSGENNQNGNPNKIVSTELYSIDPFEKGLNKEDIQLKIAQNSRNTEGNYDAMLGIVTNFNFTYTQDGGYDCSIRLMGLGVLGDSIKINNAGTLPNLLREEIIQLNNTLVEISNSINTTETPPGGSLNPSDLQAYPQCIRSLDGGKLIRIDDNKLINGINGNKPLYPYTINAIVNNISYYFYVDGNYQTTGLSKSGSYSCRDGILYIDDKKADDITKYSYQEVVQGSKDSTTQETSFQNSYFILKDKGKYDYIAINKLKSVLPIDSDKDIEATINLENIQILPSFVQNGLIVSDVLGNALNRNANQLTRSPGPIDLTRGFTPSTALPTSPVISNAPNNSTNINTDLYSGFGIAYFNPDNGRLKDGFQGGSGDDYRVELQYNGLNGNIYFLKLEYDYNARGSYKNDFLGRIVPIASKSSEVAIQNQILQALRNPSTIWKIKSVEDDKFEKKNNVTIGLFEAQTIVSINKTFKNLNQKIVGQGSDGKDILQTFDLDVKLELPITLTFSDLEILQSFSIKDPSGLILPINQRTVPTNQNPTNQPEQTQNEPQKLDKEALDIQIKQALNYQSTIEIMLRTIQLHALNKAIIDRNKDLEIGRETFVLKMTEKNERSFLNQIFTTGVFSKYIQDLVDNNIDDSDYTIGENGNYDKKIIPETRFKIHSKYGFATSLLGNKAPIHEIPKVNFEELLKAYVVPYQINQEIIKGTYTNHPVYIPLGLLLMILNHSCTIYDSKDENFQTPLVYIDFNPETNFCLTNGKHLSTDPWTCLIPFQGSFNDYKSLFDKKILTKDETAIEHVSGSTEIVPLFNPDTQDFLSGTLPKIKFGTESLETSGELYRGKMMNILLSIDYLVTLAQQNSYKDGTNSVYLKAFIEQVLSDINKSLGNFNAFRLSYNDEANTFQIIDDQFIPSLSNEEQVTPKPKKIGIQNTTELPLLGKFSIAKNLEIKSEVSSKLSNMLAISANSNYENKATLSTNGDSFGFINASYRDRYITNRGEITSGSSDFKSNNDTLKISAAQFNSAISDFYSKINPSQTSVSHATNYYIEKITLVKNNEYATRASSMIPVSVNFTTDGISGLYMGQAFTVPDILLPYTYTTRKISGAPQDHLKNVGFAVVGLTHTIENNQWNTAVRANMIYLKDKTEFTGSVVKVDTRKGALGINEFNEALNTVDNKLGTVNFSNYPVVSSNYSNIKFGKGNLGNPQNDRINPKLLEDINKAAANSGVIVTVTTAVTGHDTFTSSGTKSRHSLGNAVDIAIIDGISVSNQASVKAKVNNFVSQLQSLGYSKNIESGKTKSVLTYDFKNHDNHIHVSNIA